MVTALYISEEYLRESTTESVLPELCNDESRQGNGNKTRQELRNKINIDIHGSQIFIES